MKQGNFYIIILIAFLGLSNSLYGQKLKVGTSAPQFEAIDIYGNTVSLSSHNKSKIFLAFMRYAGCPVCNFRMHELIEKFDSLKSLGFDLIVVYESEPATLKEYLIERKVPFSVIGDPKRKLYKKFGVESSFGKTLKSAFKKQTYTAKREGSKGNSHKPKREGKLTSIPADFIISRDGMIEIAHYGKSISDHFPLNYILK